ncbi:MAG: hypothetical protein PHQ72_09560 [Hespellia sp.]|nr:hypothetical protein [Hespellia sp.]
MIYIISNVSSKTKRIAGTPYCIVNEKSKKIVSDKIDIDTKDNHLDIEFGYQHGKKLINLKATINVDSQDMYYIYKVPLLLDGIGKLRRVSKIHYCLYSTFRYLSNNTLLLLLFAIILMIVKRLWL